jgi:osmotically inducible protein OsmC
MKILTTISATTVGGRDGSGSSSDGKMNIEFALPKELGGSGKEGVTPEHLFALGYSACFGSALQYVAGQKKTTPLARIQRHRRSGALHQ